MPEYIAGALISSLCIGLVSYLAYPGASERAVKLAASVLLLYSLAIPCVKLIEGLGSFDFSEFDLENAGFNGGAYEEVSKEAFADGIKLMIAERFNIYKDDVGVFVYGFDFESMRAQSIKILLTGSAAAADYRSIEEYINGLGLGKCEVNVRIG